MDILFAVAECLPFIKTGGLADVAGALPKLLARKGHDVKVILPGFDRIDREKYAFRPYGSPFTVNHLGQDVPVSLMVSDYTPGVKTYLVCQDELFCRGKLYGEPDDQHRFIIFCKAIMAFMYNENYYPDIVHCHDWHTALLPVYIKTAGDYNSSYRKVHSVYTIHNLGYQGIFSPDTVRDAGLDPSLYNMDCMEHYGCTNFMKGAIVFADRVTTVSPTYAKEILTPQFGERLEGILRKRENDLSGVINGIDYNAWGPSEDMNIPVRYSRYRRAGKAVCKQELLRMLGLNRDNSAFVMGIVSRLCKQKGFDVLMYGMRDLLANSDSVFIVQGTGDKEYEDMAASLAADFPDSVRHIAKYSEKTARQIYAGADMFVMPSMYEPCGLGQMIALTYGTIPFVSKTGGLADTVFDVDYNTTDNPANGFVFEPLDANVIKDNLWRAYLKYKNMPQEWQKLTDAAFRCDFSWENSVREYLKIYSSCLK